MSRKTTKQLLFERMSSIGGMPIHEVGEGNVDPYEFDVVRAQKIADDHFLVKYRFITDNQTTYIVEYNLRLNINTFNNERSLDVDMEIKTSENTSSDNVQTQDIYKVISTILATFNHFDNEYGKEYGVNHYTTVSTLKSREIGKGSANVQMNKLFGVYFKNSLSNEFDITSNAGLIELTRRNPIEPIERRYKPLFR